MKHFQLMLLVLGAIAASAQAASDPSFPTPISGMPSCALPIRQLRCTVDSRSGFVAGVEFGAGPGYGMRSVCSRGAANNTNVASYYKDIIQQTSWEMSNLDDPHFPRNTSGQPNLAYYFPLGGLITQMIVLEAANPLGDSYGIIPAVIFRYYAPLTAAPGFAVCGNNRYAQAYLHPLTANPLPPTMPTLQSVFVNPLSATTQAFLASFQGKCSNRAFGFLGGDPQTQSVFHALRFQKACFTPAANVVNLEPTPDPEERPEISYDWDVPHAPCFWDKKNSASSPSVSCARTGSVVATGKYGVLMLDDWIGGAVQALPDGNGQLVASKYDGPVYQGSLPDVAFT